MAVWISATALFVSLVALGYAWKLQQELHSVTRRVDRYNRALFDANDEIRRLHETLAETTSQVRVALKRNQGHMVFEPGMTVREAQIVHPQVQQVLAGFHLGGCSSCAISPDDTLAEVCTEQGQDIDLLIQNLNLLLDGGNGHNGGAVQSVKIPNVAVDF